MSDVVLHGHHDFVPLLRFVLSERLIRTGQEVIPALELGFSNKDTAIGVRRCAKLELKNEVLRKLPGGPKLRNLSTFGRRGHNQPSIFRNVTTIAARAFSVELVCAIAPPRKIATVEKTYKTGFQ